MKRNFTWKLQDIIMVAILGTVFSAIYLAVTDAGYALLAVLTPMGLGDLAFEPIYGVWFMAATLAAYIIQKPSAAFAAEFLAAAVELPTTSAPVGPKASRFRELSPMLMPV